MDSEPDGSTAMLLTPPGGGAIAVIRLTGPRVAGFLRDHFSRPAREGRCVHGELADGPRGIDDPVVVLHPGAATADVNVHGGPWVVRATLDLARRAGFAAADPLPLPLPAGAVDADSEIEREILTHLPLGRTMLGLRVLLAQEAAWRGGPPSGAAAAAVLADQSLWRLLHPPRVAVVGAANVGKSTLANHLFAAERSITADFPGTTRDWVGEIADVNGLAVELVDTPGLRATPDPIERDAIGRGREQIAAADLVILVLDASRPLSPEQSPLLAEFPRALRVANKCDRPAAWDVNAVEAVHTVGTSGEGIEALRRAVAARFGCDAMDETVPRWWTARQRGLLE